MILWRIQSKECLPILLKGCGNIAEHVERLPKKCWHVADLRVGVYKRCRTTIWSTVASGTSWICEAFTLYFSFEYKLKWMSCLLLLLLPLIAEEKWEVLGHSRLLHSFLLLSLGRQTEVYAYIRTCVFRGWLSSIFQAKSLLSNLPLSRTMYMYSFKSSVQVTPKNVDGVNSKTIGKLTASSAIIRHIDWDSVIWSA